MQAATPPRMLISASRDRTLRVWDVRSGQALHTLRDAAREAARLLSKGWTE